MTITQQLVKAMGQTPPYELIRYGDVSVTKVINDKKKTCAMISMPGVSKQYTHAFSHRSRVSHHLDTMTVEELANELSSGHYFFVNDQLVAFQPGSYSAHNGFVHDDGTIGVLMDVIGCRPRHEQRFNRGRRRATNEDDVGTTVELKKEWNEHGIHVPGYSEVEGNLSSRLSFGWNPFVRTISSSFDLVREKDESGIVGLTSWLNTKIPLLNRWIEHLEIACKQIQNRVHDTIVERVTAMALERGSVADCLLLEQHCFDRIHSAGEHLDAAERIRLETIMQAVSPRNHLHKFYRDSLFDDRILAAQAPGHLSNLDLYTICAEIRSHTTECSKSSHAALDRLANRLMFDLDRDFSVTSIGASSHAGAFSTSDNAFFGVIS